MNTLIHRLARFTLAAGLMIMNAGFALYDLRLLIN